LIKTLLGGLGKATLYSISTALIIVALLFVLFSQFNIENGDEKNKLDKFVEENGGVSRACLIYLSKYITLQNFEFNISSYRPGHGKFGNHFVSTAKLVLAAITFLFITISVLSWIRLARKKRRNIVGSFLSGVSTIHTLIFLAAIILIIKVFDVSFWLFVVVIVFSNNIFKEFYVDLNTELDRILSEKYVQRAVAWGGSPFRYALPEIMITFSRKISSKFPLLLSSTFIIEYYSPKNAGLANDLLTGIAHHDYFLVMSVTGILVFATTLIYNSGRIPERILDPRSQG
jgi:hypothetical protein